MKDFYGKRDKISEDKEKVRVLFSAIARKYDLGNQIISFGTHIHYKKQALLELSLKPGQKLLDCCTGTGDMVFLALNLFPGIQAIGIDISEEMIQVASERLNAYPALKSRATFMKGDATNLSFGDEEFDTVTTAFGLRNISEKEDFFKEAYRVLKKEGKLVVLEFSNPDDSSFGFLYRIYLKFAVPVLGYLTTGNFEAYKYLTDSIHGYSKISEIKEIAEKAGFDFKAKKLLLGFLSLYICEKKDGQ